MKKWLLSIAAIVVICSVTLWFVQYRFFHMEPLNKGKAISYVEALYSGHVTQAKQQGNDYVMAFTKGDAVYTVILDATTQQIKALELQEGDSPLLLTEGQIRRLVEKVYGDVESVVLTDAIYTVHAEKENQQKELTLDAYTGEVLSEKDVQPVESPKSPTVISEQQAIKIALQQLAGEVDSIEYEETEEGGYYLVEIETKDEEAVFQIHAVSGKVISVTWDE